MRVRLKMGVIDACRGRRMMYRLMYERDAELSMEPRVGESVVFIANPEREITIKRITHSFDGGIVVLLDNLFIEYSQSETARLVEWTKRLENAGWKMTSRSQHTSLDTLL